MPPPQGTWNPIEGPGDYTMTKEVHNESYPGIDPAKLNLSRKAVFIAGASKGVGRDTAASYAKAGASYIAIGARSSLSDTENDVKTAAKKAGRSEPQILLLKLDITDQKNVDAAVKEIGEKFGKLDVVINNAGVFAGRGLVGESDPEDWWWCMNVNLRGPYLVTRACLPLLLESDLKTLITVSSVGAHVVGPTLSAYQTSKLAVLRFTQFVAAENAEQGLIAISVHPGNMLTEIVGHGEGFDEKLKAVFTEVPQLPADSMVFLSAERREWLSGRYVNCTWDLPELVGEAKREEIVREDKLKIRLVV
ncbi:hypothetical protein M409DRAFT_25383 [Zasmidium cellare ATCC 36951]|uniref:Uncharacterized protein n=1 Tax=Zasmidium cellare ATCC 36951 TaxID=1080233 RepID=A0A6A6CGF3_ZASCE|nr:uncharacterized protein M409DRAFT_25383 [Zasmidium cellare ATCC 36951]KAF2164506.1 hypothetical protein M409DRAFT_25383 [Zasmidium cellare ATCC 36951]